MPAAFSTGCFEGEGYRPEQTRHLGRFDSVLFQSISDMADPTPTSDRLRHRIDSGETDEKVDFPDPAAAPLGTDAEAGGKPPTARERKMEAMGQAQAKSRTDIPGLGLYAILGAIAYVIVLGAGGLALAGLQ